MLGIRDDRGGHTDVHQKKFSLVVAYHFSSEFANALTLLCEMYVSFTE